MITPGDVDSRIGVPAHVVDWAIDYRNRAARQELDAAVSRWIARAAGRGGGKFCIYAYGNSGSGKTIGLVRAAYRAVVEAGLADWVAVLKEAELLAAHEQRYSDDRLVQRRALEWIRVATEAPLLLADEWFSRSSYTEAATALLAETLHARFERRLPTLFSSNNEPQFGFYDAAGRIASRFGGATEVVRCFGPDMRVG